MSVNGAGAFPAVIGDVLMAVPDSLDAIVASASTDCVVQELKEVDPAAWPVLAARDRIMPTPSTLVRYLEVVGLDAQLGELLLRSGVELADDDDEDLKRTVAVRLLAGVAILPSPAVRADLAASLHLEEPLTPPEVPREEGQLLALLLGRDLVEDGPSAFTVLLAEDWPGRDAAVAASPGFSGFATQQELPVAYVEHFLASDVVPAATKDVVVERFAELTEGVGPNVLTAVADHALRRNLALSFDDVQRLAHAGVSPDRVVPLLQPHLQPTEAPDVLALLRVLGRPYPALTERKGKHPDLPATAPNRILLAWLETQGLVSSFREAGGVLRVHMKRDRD